MRIIISLLIQPKILRKSHVSKIFREKLIFADFHVYFQCIQIYEDALTFWRHSDQWYLFWYQWIEEVHTYIYALVANIWVSGVLHRKSSLRRTCYKYTSGGRGLMKEHCYRRWGDQGYPLYGFSVAYRIVALFCFVLSKMIKYISYMSVP